MAISTVRSSRAHSDLEAISLALRSARHTNSALPGFPGTLPATLEEAYAIQALSIRAWPDEIAGWKVGGVPPQFQSVFKTDRLAGPIFSRTVRHAQDGARVAMPAYHGGFVAVEAEYVAVLGDVSGFEPAHASPADVAAVIASMHVGVEIASSPMALINEIGPAAVVSDFGNNFGLVLGPAIAGWTDTRLTTLPIAVKIDGARVGAATAKAGLDGPLGAVRFLIAHLQASGQPVPVGLMVSTGAVTGVHDTTIGTHARVSFDGIAQLYIDTVEI